MPSSVRRHARIWEQVALEQHSHKEGVLLAGKGWVFRTSFMHRTGGRRMACRVALIASRVQRPRTVSLQDRELRPHRIVLSLIEGASSSGTTRSGDRPQHTHALLFWRRRWGKPNRAWLTMTDRPTSRSTPPSLTMETVAREADVAAKGMNCELPRRPERVPSNPDPPLVMADGCRFAALPRLHRPLGVRRLPPFVGDPRSVQRRSDGVY